MRADVQQRVQATGRQPLAGQLPSHRLPADRPLQGGVRQLGQVILPAGVQRRPFGPQPLEIGNRAGPLLIARQLAGDGRRGPGPFRFPAGPRATRIPPRTNGSAISKPIPARWQTAAVAIPRAAWPQSRANGGWPTFGVRASVGRRRRRSCYLFPVVIRFTRLRQATSVPAAGRIRPPRQPLSPARKGPVGKPGWTQSGKSLIYRPACRFVDQDEPGRFDTSIAFLVARLLFSTLVASAGAPEILRRFAPVPGISCRYFSFTGFPSNRFLPPAGRPAALGQSMSGGNRPERSWAMKVPRSATQSLNRRRQRCQQTRMVSLVAAIAALGAAFSGCQSQQSNPNDPFLPFMRTRVPAPGTNVPADPYYPGGATSTAPPAAGLPPTPPPAVGAPSTVPTSTPMPPADKYSPRGGFNLPQSSIDRSKAATPIAGEVKAGGTAIARLSRPKTGADTSGADGPLAAAGAAATSTTTTAARPTAETVAGDSDSGPTTLAASEVASRPDSSAAGSAENLAFADAPAAAAAENESDRAGDDRSALVATAGRWSSGGSGSTASTTGRRHLDPYRRSRSALRRHNRPGDDRSRRAGWRQFRRPNPRRIARLDWHRAGF